MKLYFFYLVIMNEHVATFDMYGTDLTFKGRGKIFFLNCLYCIFTMAVIKISRQKRLN